MGKITEKDKYKKIQKNNDKENRPIPLLFHNISIIGYLKIIAQLIIVVDLQINQCKFSINFFVFSPFTKVYSQLKARTL